MHLASVKRLLIGAGMAALAAAMPLSWAAAATTSATFTVTAQVQTNCSITTQNLNFGNYSGAALAATTTVSATCSTGTPYNIGLDAGTSTGATVTTRHMTGPSGADLLSYSLFQDAGHSVNWGNTVGTDTVAGTGNGVAQPITVFGQIPAAQFTTAGSYTDTITATLTF